MVADITDLIVADICTGNNITDSVVAGITDLVVAGITDLVVAGITDSVFTDMMTSLALASAAASSIKSSLIWPR
jgi:hypothetical protein